MPRLLALPFMLIATAAGCTDEAGAGGDGDGVDDPLRVWEESRPGEAVAATLTFAEAQDDSAAVLLTAGADLRPFRARVEVGGVRSVREVERDQASSEFISRLHEEMLTELRMARCAQQGRALAVLGEWEVEAGRAVLATLHDIERGTVALTAGEPYIHALTVVGTVENIREAAADPRVVGLHATPPDEEEEGSPEWEETPGGQIPPAIRGLPPEEVRRRLRDVAEDVEGCGPPSGGEVVEGPGPPR